MHLLPFFLLVHSHGKDVFRQFLVRVRLIEYVPISVVLLLLRDSLATWLTAHIIASHLSTKPVDIASDIYLCGRAFVQIKRLRSSVQVL